MRGRLERLRVEALSKSFFGVRVLHGVSFEAWGGRVLGIVGESGSGKSVTSSAVMGLLPGSAQITGSVKFRGRELLGLNDKQFSEVRGKLRAGLTPFDLLRACFPAGTVSGAPKVRAMQIISELEGYRRGPYAGAVGYALPDGTLDTCIAIRTIVLHDGLALLQAGAGIVADSDPHAEHEECMRKLAALELSIELAEARR